MSTHYKCFGFHFQNTYVSKTFSVSNSLYSTWACPMNVLIYMIKNISMIFLNGNQAFGVMQANALLMQYHYFYCNIAIFYYILTIMIYCNIALFYFRKCIILFALLFFWFFKKYIYFFIFRFPWLRIRFGKLINIYLLNKCF